ncbi:MAG: coenzyme F420-0:L-glutamate ligase [Alphaproteobacteria bacterium]|nr:MAG: coenzyme F420-0:L-glutamate ligase [Alphaproteobacteria bacterium]
MAQISLIPVRTRPFLPPQDSVTDELIKALPPLHEQDVVVVTSKIVAIGQGRCVPVGSIDKKTLIEREADALIPGQTSRYDVTLTIKDGTLIASAGIDESNSQGYYTLWPQDAAGWARSFCAQLRQARNISELAVIVTDSHCTPMRWGVTGISIGFHGLQPLRDYRGQQDIFGRPLRFTQSNIVDAIAVAAVSVMGEGDECTPVVIVRGWPGLTLTDQDHGQDLTIAREDDIFAPLLVPFVDKTKP